MNSDNYLTIGDGFHQPAKAGLVTRRLSVGGPLKRTQGIRNASAVEEYVGAIRESPWVAE